MENNIITLSEPIKVREGIIDRIDISKITKDLYKDKEYTLDIEDGNLMPQYETFLYYKDGKVYLRLQNLDIEEEEYSEEVELTEEEITDIITKYINNMPFVYNEIIKKKVSELKKIIFERNNYILFEHQEIKCKYGLIDNTCIFNRAYFNKYDELVLCEVVGDVDLEFYRDMYIELYVNDDYIIRCEATTDDIINTSGVLVKYMTIENGRFSICKKENITHKDLEFKIPENIELPPIVTPMNGLSDLHPILQKQNYFKDIENLYKINKLPSMTIKIFDYLL